MELGYKLIEIKPDEEWKLKIADYELGCLKGDTAVVTLRIDIHLSESNRIAIYGKMMTENLGLSYVLCNILANPRIRYLFVCGLETMGHFSGNSLLSLYYHGVVIKDGKIKVKGTKSADPTLPIEVDQIEDVVKRLREQVEIIDIMGVTDPDVIYKEIEKRARKEPFSNEPFYLRFKKLGSVEIPGGEIIIDPLISITDQLLVREVV